MPINFPDSPNVNQQFTVDGNTWRWTGSTWDIVLAVALGPTGPTGATGATGASGANGTTGANGAGYDGITSSSSITTLASQQVLSFTVNKIGALATGSRVRFVNTDSKWVEGTILTIVGLVVTISTDLWSNPGTYSSWTLSLTGVPGVTGPTGADAPTVTSISQKTADYTLVLADKSSLVEVSHTNLIVPVIVSVPADATANFANGTTLTILRTNTGGVDIQGAPGVIVNSTPTQSLRARWSSASLIKRSSNLWVLVGDLA
jgi:hypothetical protein